MEFYILYFLIVILIIIGPKYVRYRNSEYKIVSGNGFLKTVFNKGNYGEFMTFSYLEKLTGYKKLITNLYLPKEDGTTTEIDLIMIFETGIYVFESKNYSGWIFGDEKNNYWTQCLPNKQKNRFFNPIWQNKGHINSLKAVLENDNDHFYKSYIIFSERCTLKKINVISSNVKVLKRNELIKTIKNDINNSSIMIATKEIDNLYSILQKYSHVNEAVKKAHVDNIKKNVIGK